MSYAYVWFIWSLGLVSIWLAIYLRFKKGRRRMVWASVLTMPFGLTEPLFVPEYWNPPSLFGLAQKTGFDIESLIFCFAIGGLGITLYDIIFKVEHLKMDFSEKRHRRHRFHLLTLISPIIIFLFLHFFSSLNPIYNATISMFVAALAALWCRLDLKRKIWISGLIFLLFYLVYFLTLEWSAPGYVENVWRLSAVSGIRFLQIPIEELIFAFTFGMLWSSYYEHLNWVKIKSRGIK